MDHGGDQELAKLVGPCDSTVAAWNSVGSATYSTGSGQEQCVGEDKGDLEG
jgi:hypothetical protein